MSFLASLLNFGSKKEPVAAPKNILQPRAFHPTFFGTGWSGWRGPADGGGLLGEDERDLCSLALPYLDLSQVDLDVRLREGESYISCEEWLKRLLAEKADFVRLGPEFALAFREEPEKWPWGDKVVFFDGWTLRSPGGSRCAVCAFRRGERVFVHCFWLGSRRDADCPSALLAKRFVPRA